MASDDLIDQLTRDLKPVPKPDSPRLTTLKWGGSVLLWAVIFMEFVSPRADFWESLQKLSMLLQLLAYSILIFLSLYVVAWFSSPGREEQKPLAKISWIFLGSFGVYYVLRLLGMNPESLQEGLSLSGSNCMMIALAAGLFVGLLLVNKVRRGASVHPVKSGLFIALTSLGAGGLAITIHCGNENGMHIFMWHFFLPLLILNLLGFWIGNITLRW